MNHQTVRVIVEITNPDLQDANDIRVVTRTIADPDVVLGPMAQQAVAKALGAYGASGFDADTILRVAEGRLAGGK